MRLLQQFVNRIIQPPIIIALAIILVSLPARSSIAVPSFTVLHSFSDDSNTNDGRDPLTLIQGSDGNFYGTTQSGGIYDKGTIFKMSPSGEVTILYSFTSAPGNQRLAEGPDGCFYGVLSEGSTKNGVIYKISSSGEFTILHTFADGSVLNDGKAPSTSLTLAPDGYFYGMTFRGGAALDYANGAEGYGTIYKISPSGAYTLLHNFSDGSVLNDGAYPNLDLTLGKDGNLYGVTKFGGSYTPYFYHNGVVFKFSPSSGAITILHAFLDGTLFGDGAIPNSSITQGTDGNFYGVTLSGGSTFNGVTFLGPTGWGTIYRISPSGTISILHSFNDGITNDTSIFPSTSLFQAQSGNFYGIASKGVYQLTPSFIYTPLDGNQFINLFSYGWMPNGWVQTANGSIYGVSTNGGNSNHGMIFKSVPSDTSISVSTFKNPELVGKMVTLTATVIGNDPTGTVQFTIDGSPIGPRVVLINGTATYSSSQIPEGTHSITAEYNGDLFNNGSISATYIQTINRPLSIRGINPKSVYVNSGDFILTIDGSGFTDSSEVSFDGSPLPVTHISNEQISVPISNAYINTVKNVIIKVTNPDGQMVLIYFDVVYLPSPTITSLSPSTVSGAKTFTLTVNGTNFVPGSIIKWNGTNMTTTYVSPTQLTASINKFYTTLLSYPGSATVTVVNPGGKRTSNTTVTITAPLPAITSLSSSSITGAKTFTLTVNGTNFVSGSIIKWNGTNMTTTYVSATQLTATINKYYTTLSSYPGSASISVLNPDGNRSSNATLTITAPLPVISSLAPTSVQGATNFTVTVNGTGFQSGAVIKWNGTNMTTTFVSSTQLTASINKYYDTLSSYPGSATVSVLNPDSGRSVGATMAITQP